MHTLIMCMVSAVLASIATAVICTAGHRRKLQRAYEDGKELREYTDTLYAYKDEEAAYGYVPDSASETVIMHEDVLVPPVSNVYVPPAYHPAYVSEPPSAANPSAEVAQFMQDMDAETALFCAHLEAQTVRNTAAFTTRIHDGDCTDQIPAIILRETTTREATTREVVLNNNR